MARRSIWNRRARGSDGRRTRGQSLVEFALILPVFILLFGGALDMGRLFYAQITLTNAAREGALQAGEDPDTYTGGACDPETNLVVCRVTLEAADSFISIQPSDISMSCTPSCERALGNHAVVSVQGQFTFLTPIVSPFFGGTTITLTSTARAQIQTYPTVVPVQSSPDPIPTAPPTATPEPTPEPTPQPTPEPTPEPSAGATPAPSSGATPPASATPAPTPTPFPYDCTQNDGTPGVIPPNVIGASKNAADAAILAKEFKVAASTVNTGKPGVVHAQSPDNTVCAPRGSTISYIYRP